MQYGHYTMSTPPSPAASIPLSVSDLSYQMSQYSLQQSDDYPPPHPSESQTYPTFTSGRSNRSPSPFSDPLSPASTSSPSSPLSTQPSSYFPSSTSLSSSSSPRLNSGYHSANVRQQRQRALRRQCSASHLREISALVSRMVSEGDQCSVSSTGAGERVRHNSDPGSDASSAHINDYAADDEAAESMEEDSELEPFNDSWDGFRFPEGAGFADWQCPWTSRPRSSHARCCVTKDTSARKGARRRV